MSTTTIAQVADVASRAATDSSFRQQLINSPAATLQSNGVPIPSGASVQILENTSSVRYLVLPPRPSGVSDADLKQTSTSTTTPSSIAETLDGFGRLVVSAWTDSNLKSRLLQDPASVLAERGLSVPSGVTVKAVEATASNCYFVVPESQS